MTVPPLSVTIDRSGLGLADLVIRFNPQAGTPLWLPEDGVVEPGWAFRTTYAPESAYYSGHTKLAAVLDASTLQLVVMARETSTTALSVAKRLLEAALSQWAYDVTLSIDGASATWEADPCWPQWGQVDSGMTAQGVARATLTIPINPAGGMQP